MKTGTNDVVHVWAWLELGTERRETLIEIPRAEYEVLTSTWDPESAVEEYVRDWMEGTIGWGWAGEGHQYSVDQDSKGANLVVTNRSAYPNTRRMKSHLRCF